MRHVCALFLAFAIGAVGLAADFAAQGRMDGAGWYWSRDLYAQWRLFDLAWEGEHLVFVVTLETRGWPTPPPPVLGVVLTFSSFGSPSRTQSVTLQRVAEQGPFVRYFGQVVLARRDIGFGSYLAVSLRARAEAEVGVSAQALKLVQASPALAGAAGMGGPFLSLASVPPASVESTRTHSVSKGEGEGVARLTIRECTGLEDAPFLAPGIYHGELGWAGPGNDLDSHDWFRVNLRSGQRLDLRITTPQPVVVMLWDPAGQEVGRLKGQGQLGLVYEARKHGAYAVCIALAESAPTFSYTVEVLIRR